MKKAIFLSTICLVLAGCSSSEITVTPELHKLERVRVCITQIASADAGVSNALKTSIEQELMKAGIEVVEQSAATVKINGTAFVTNKYFAIVDNISIKAISYQGDTVLLATFNNKGDLSAVEAGKSFGRSIAKKLR